MRTIMSDVEVEAYSKGWDESRAAFYERMQTETGLGHRTILTCIINAADDMPEATPARVALKGVARTIVAMRPEQGEPADVWSGGADSRLWSGRGAELKRAP